MKNIFSSILSIFAPWARAKLMVSEKHLGYSYSEFVNLVSKELITKKTGDSFSKFRVKGDFFAKPEATQVVLGVKANPAHFSNIGFNFIVKELGEGMIQLIAEERVILGYLETKAASVALGERLNHIVEYSRKNFN